MLTLDQIKQLLKDRRPSMVADSIGVHVNTILQIRDDPDANPTYRVVAALSDYLEGKSNG